MERGRGGSFMSMIRQGGLTDGTLNKTVRGESSDRRHTLITHTHMHIETLITHTHINNTHTWTKMSMSPCFRIQVPFTSVYSSCTSLQPNS